MLYIVFHLWPYGACFLFNCYWNWSLIVLRNGNGTVSFIHSREGMAQGGSLAMLAYNIGILLLTKQLKVGFTDFTHTWYADYAGALGTFTNVELYFNSLKRFGPGRGYCPKPSKKL